MAYSFIKFLDDAMRARVFYKFGPYLGLTNYNRDTVFAPREVAFRQVSEKRGAAQMEFISVWRESTAFDWDRQRSVVSRNGVYPIINSTTTEQVKSVPATVEYSIRFWSRSLDNLAWVTETYLFWQHEDPNLNLTINSVYPAEFDLHFGRSVDESPVAQMYEKGSYYVISCPVTVDGWILNNRGVPVIKTIYMNGYDNQDNEDGVLIFSDTIYGKLEYETATATDSVLVTKE